jgi:hypothetical protein
MDNTIENLVNNYNTAKSIFQENVSFQLRLEVKRIFEEFPRVTKLGFVGYTPYFNDGDPCMYSASTDSGTLCYLDNENEEVEIVHDDIYNYRKENNDYIKYSTVPEDIEQASNKFVSLIDNIPDEILQDVFEEGRTIFSRDGTYETEDYYHD